jgi:trimeric autotransporter adhesin
MKPKNMTTLRLIKSIGRSSSRLALLLIPVVFACFALSPMAQAVSPPPDGGYPGGTTAEGENALLSLTTGQFNTAAGWLSLFANTTGNFNTAVGAGTLFSNNADGNTAVGAGALALNTTGKGNTANGATALLFNTAGSGNTAVGAQALQSNAPPGGQLGDSSLNTAVGVNALSSNTTGGGNTAVGAGAGQTDFGFIPAALGSNTCGRGNTAVGAGGESAALGSNTTGNFNTAVGGTSHYPLDDAALGGNTTGSENTVFGAGALNRNTTGSGNIAVGVRAGRLLNTGNNNIYIGNDGAEESATIRIGTDNIPIPPEPEPCETPTGTPTPTPTGTPTPTPTPVPTVPTRTFIAGIRGTTTGITDAINVVIDSHGQLGTMSSSVRFKKEIKPMDKASEAILALKPVTFHYKSDKTDTPQFGLIAEDVAQVNPDLVVRNKDGEIYTVRYDQVNAMLLNEFLKEHRTVQEQQNEIDVLRAELKEQRALIQKVNDKVELAKPVPQTVLNNQ